MIIKPKIEYINYNLTVIVNLQKANILTTKYINIMSRAFRVLSHWGQRLILMSDSYLRFFSSSNLFAKSSKSTSWPPALPEPDTGMLLEGTDGRFGIVSKVTGFPAAGPAPRGAGIGAPGGAHWPLGPTGAGNWAGAGYWNGAAAG